MCGRFYQGEAMEKTLAWAESELEGFMRNRQEFAQRFGDLTRGRARLL
jgi:hypothetical protein